MPNAKNTLDSEIKRYEALRDQCERMITNMNHGSLELVEDSYAHAFKEIIERQIDTLRRAVAAVA